MRSLFPRSIVFLLFLVPLAFAFADEPPKALPLAQHGISLLAQPQNGGWDVRFQLAKVIDGARIRYRRLGAEDWHAVAEASEVVVPLDLGPIGTGEQVVELEVIDPEGEGTGLFRVSFAPEKER